MAGAVAIRNCTGGMGYIAHVVHVLPQSHLRNELPHAARHRCLLLVFGPDLSLFPSASMRAGPVCDGRQQHALQDLCSRKGQGRNISRFRGKLQRLLSWLLQRSSWRHCMCQLPGGYVQQGNCKHGLRVLRGRHLFSCWVRELLSLPRQCEFSSRQFCR